jgi:hypothetical protein
MYKVQKPSNSDLYEGQKKTDWDVIIKNMKVLTAYSLKIIKQLEYYSHKGTYSLRQTTREYDVKNLSN